MRISSSARIRLAAVFFAPVLLAGCRVAQLRNDQDRFRSTLLELQTNQIMDNLIRARNGLPIVHMDYQKVVGTITQKADVGLDGSYLDAVGVITSGLNYSLGLNQQAQLDLTGAPATDPTVYCAYLDFLGNSDRLQKTTEPPPCGAAHLCRQHCDGCYYWVPIEYRLDFLELALKTGAMRGELPLIKSQQSVSIKQVSEIEVESLAQGKPKVGSRVSMTVTFDQEVANDRGYLVFLYENNRYRAILSAMDVLSGTSKDDKTKKTNKLTMRYRFGPDRKSGQIPMTPEMLQAMVQKKPLPVILYPARGRLVQGTPERLLENIEDELTLLRLRTQ